MKRVDTGHDFEAGAAVMVGTFPESGLVLSGHGRMILPDSPKPFAVFRVADILPDKTPACDGLLQESFIATDLVSV